MQQRKLYQFDSFCLDASAKVLSRDGQAVSITRKAAETLLALAENGGQVVLKEDLMRAIWPDRVVEEANLTQNIAMVRRALGVERGSAAYIETFPGRGYRLVGPVVIEESNGTGSLAAASAEPNGHLEESQAMLAPPVPAVSIPAAVSEPTARPSSIKKASFAAVAVLVLSGVILGAVLF
ncbi:MAG: transcriptional regulator, partial [Acidobacteria bacterium]|nr:transcriptional regulator [Acidobacteriota bacterium]